MTEEIKTQWRDWKIKKKSLKENEKTKTSLQHTYLIKDGYPKQIKNF